MGFRIRRSVDAFARMDSHVCTSIGVPGTGIDLYARETGDRKFIVATLVVLAVAALVWFAA